MTTDDFEKGRKWERLEALLANPAPIYDAIGLLMVAESQQAFVEQSFGGIRWRPRGGVNVFGLLADFEAGRKPPKRRFATGPALQDTGRLASSISHRVLANGVEVGTTLEYAQVHQEGGRTKSARLTPKVQKRVAEWLKRQKDDDLTARLGYLTSPRLTNKQLDGRVPRRPFIGVTRQTRADIGELLQEMFSNV